MKKITVLVDDELYRRAQAAAAEADSTVTALVREFSTTLTEPQTTSNRTGALLATINRIRQRHPGFDPGNRLSRDEIHLR